MKYPIGIQTFGQIRDGGYIYVDKTDLVYKMACCLSSETGTVSEFEVRQ